MENSEITSKCNRNPSIGIKKLKEMIRTIKARARGCTEREYFWRIVFNFLEKVNEEDFASYTKTGIIVKFLLNSLHRYGSSNTNHIKDIIRRYTIWLNRNYLGFPSTTFRPFTYMPDLMVVAKGLLDTNYLDHIIYYKDELAQVDTMHFATEYADKELTDCLVKYGSYTLGKMCLSELEIVITLFIRTWFYLNWNKIRNEHPHREVPYLLSLQFLQYISLKHPVFPEKRPKAHVVLILKILKAIIMKLEDEPCTQQYVICLKQFYQIIPEPYIPCEDLKELLHFLLKYLDQKEKEEIIETYLATYVELFGVETTTYYTPRSLKHLTRCVVRNEITRNSKTLEKSVKHLCLPETLKHLLLGASE